MAQSARRRFLARFKQKAGYPGSIMNKPVVDDRIFLTFKSENH
jgi:hypothetical protein